MLSEKAQAIAEVVRRVEGAEVALLHELSLTYRRMVRDKRPEDPGRVARSAR